MFGGPDAIHMNKKNPFILMFFSRNYNDSEYFLTHIFFILIQGCSKSDLEAVCGPGNDVMPSMTRTGRKVELPA